MMKQKGALRHTVEQCPRTGRKLKRHREKRKVYSIIYKYTVVLFFS
jgi:hypothetical protein